jgi:hypothetical protein
MLRGEIGAARTYKVHGSPTPMDERAKARRGHFRIAKSVNHVNENFELTRDNIIGELVDAHENLLDESQTFDSGAELTIIRGPHPWGTAKGIEYCTVQIGGKHFNIPARLLASSIKPKRS